jgi:hypothetical protein
MPAASTTSPRADEEPGRCAGLSLIRRNLEITVEERFLQLMELQRFAAELERAGAEASKR